MVSRGGGERLRSRLRMGARGVSCEGVTKGVGSRDLRRRGGGCRGGRTCERSYNVASTEQPFDSMASVLMRLVATICSARHLLRRRPMRRLVRLPHSSSTPSRPSSSISQVDSPNR